MNAMCKTNSWRQSSQPTLPRCPCARADNSVLLRLAEITDAKDKFAGVVPGDLRGGFDPEILGVKADRNSRSVAGEGF